eukprot:tig00020539_g10421.t1
MSAVGVNPRDPPRPASSPVSPPESASKPCPKGQIRAADSNRSVRSRAPRRHQKGRARPPSASLPASRRSVDVAAPDSLARCTESLSASEKLLTRTARSAARPWCMRRLQIALCVRSAGAGGGRCGAGATGRALAAGARAHPTCPTLRAHERASSPRARFPNPSEAARRS